MYAVENVKNLGKQLKCSAEQQVLESVHTLGHFSTQMNNREDATKEELQEHTLYTQIKTNEKNMLLSSRDFLQSMRVKRVDRNAQRRAELEIVKKRFE